VLHGFLALSGTTIIAITIDTASEKHLEGNCGAMFVAPRFNLRKRGWWPSRFVLLHADLVDLRDHHLRADLDGGHAAVAARSR
jgi:hypothetical protein